jgi:G3E family GTPase
MKTTVVSGLLGSGKTTFIRNFVKGRTEKTVVLVNDFGAAGIDGEIFSANGIESVELPSGCVCCTLKFDLITTIGKIVKEFAPEHLMIEPSGVASPAGVLEALESAHAGPATVVGIVDAVEFTELHESGMYGSFFEDQISLADVVLVNKIDLAGEEATGEVVRRVEALNPRAVLFRTVHAGLSEPLPGAPPAARSAGHGHEHLAFSTLSIRLLPGVDYQSFSKQLDRLAAGEFGNVVRAKALVQTDKGPFRFDVVFGRTDSAPFEQDVRDSRVVIIGEDLDTQAIEQMFSGPRGST